MGFPWLPLGIWAGGQVLSGLLGGRGTKGAEKHKPKPYQPRPFEPFMMPIEEQLALIRQNIEAQGQKQTRGMVQQAASTGTYYGGQPGATQIAQSQQETMAQAELALRQQQMDQVYRQYLQHIAHEYGMESAEYGYAYDEYMKRLQGAWQGAGALGAGWGSFMGSMGPYMMGGGGGETTGTTGWGGGSRWTGAGGRRPPGSLQ